MSESGFSANAWDSMSTSSRASTPTEWSAPLHHPNALPIPQPQMPLPNNAQFANIGNAQMMHDPAASNFVFHGQNPVRSPHPPTNGHQMSIPPPRMASYDASQARPALPAPAVSNDGNIPPVEFGAFSGINGLHTRSDYVDFNGVRRRSDYVNFNGVHRRSDYVGINGLHTRSDYVDFNGVVHRRSDYVGINGLQTRPDYTGINGLHTRSDYVGFNGVHTRSDYAVINGLHTRSDYAVINGLHTRSDYHLEAFDQPLASPSASPDVSMNLNGQRSTMGSTSSRSIRQDQDQGPSSGSPRSSNRRSFDRYSVDLPQTNTPSDAGEIAARMPPASRVRHGIRSAQMLPQHPVHNSTLRTEELMRELKASFPRHLASELAETTSKTCYICSEDFSNSAVTPSSEAEVALELPCGHYFGEFCLGYWFDTCKAMNNKVTCPMCRKQLIELPSPSLHQNPHRHIHLGHPSFHRRRGNPSGQ